MQIRLCHQHLVNLALVQSVLLSASVIIICSLVPQWWPQRKFLCELTCLFNALNKLWIDLRRKPTIAAVAAVLVLCAVPIPICPSGLSVVFPVGA